jgi:hypothetical protein
MMVCSNCYSKGIDYVSRHCHISFLSWKRRVEELKNAVAIKMPVKRYLALLMLRIKPHSSACTWWYVTIPDATWNEYKSPRDLYCFDLYFDDINLYQLMMKLQSTVQLHKLHMLYNREIALAQLKRARYNSSILKQTPRLTVTWISTNRLFHLSSGMSHDSIAH